MHKPNRLILIEDQIHLVNGKYGFDKDLKPSPINELGWKVFDKIGLRNSALSPLSLYEAFGMLINGAKDSSDTQKELLDLLSMDTVKDVNDALSGSHQKIERDMTDDVTFSSANLLLANKGNDEADPVIESYRKVIEDIYKGDVWARDIQEESDSIIMAVRDFVRDNTEGLINHYNPLISEDTEACLYDVLYFKGKWQYPFDSIDVEKRDFTDSEGEVHRVDMMGGMKYNSIRYYEDERFRGFEFPYNPKNGEDSDFVMYFILPSDDGLNVRKQWMSEDVRYREQFIEKISNMDYLEGFRYMIPKYRIQNDHDLREILETLGVDKLFSEQSELDGILSTRPVIISDILQKTDLTVDEEGTEAAAVTEMISITSNPSMSFDQFARMVCDIPFIYILRHKGSGINLFVGLVDSPKKGIHFTHNSGKVPFYHPTKGWCIDDEYGCNEFEAQEECRRVGIPYYITGEQIPKRRLLLRTKVVGMDFISGIEEVLSKIGVGDYIHLMLEPDNRYDRNAIAVMFRGDKIGYIPRGQNEVLANLMNQDVELDCKVFSVGESRLIVSIYMVSQLEYCVTRHFSEYWEMFGNHTIRIDSRPISRNDFCFRDIGKNYVSVEMKRTLYYDELWNLSWGHLARVMEDKWNCFLENDILYICRSWTGFCIYRLHLDEDKGYTLDIDTEEHTYKGDTQEEIELVNALIDGWLEDVYLPADLLYLGITGNVRYLERGPSYGWTVEPNGDVVIGEGLNPPVEKIVTREE